MDENKTFSFSSTLNYNDKLTFCCKNLSEIEHCYNYRGTDYYGPVYIISHQQFAYSDIEVLPQWEYPMEEEHLIFENCYFDKCVLKNIKNVRFEDCFVGDSDVHLNTNNEIGGESISFHNCIIHMESTPTLQQTLSPKMDNCEIYNFTPDDINQVNFFSMFTFYGNTLHFKDRPLTKDQMAEFIGNFCPKGFTSNFVYNYLVEANINGTIQHHFMTNEDINLIRYMIENIIEDAPKDQLFDIEEIVTDFIAVKRL